MPCSLHIPEFECWYKNNNDNNLWLFFYLHWWSVIMQSALFCPLMFLRRPLPSNLLPTDGPSCGLCGWYAGCVYVDHLSAVMMSSGIANGRRRIESIDCIQRFGISSIMWNIMSSLSDCQSFLRLRSISASMSSPNLLLSEKIFPTCIVSLLKRSFVVVSLQSL